jgi:molybdopterin synthase sulfur carrier subunit
MAQLLFLGRLEDIAGAAELSVPLAGPTPLAELIARLPAAMAAAVTGPRIRLALNGTLLANRDPVIAESDELAFLPPVSGG